VKTDRTDDGIEIKLPENAPDAMASVIKLEIKGQVELKKQMAR